MSKKSHADELSNICKYYYFNLHMDQDILLNYPGPEKL